MNVRRSGVASLLALLIALTLAAPARPARGPRPDLTAAIRATLPVWPQNDITINVTLKNAGDAPAPKSICFVYIRNAHPPRQTVKRIKKTVRALEPGDVFAFAFKIRLSLGMYEIEAVADRSNRIAEPDEENNKARLTVTGR